MRLPAILPNFPCQRRVGEGVLQTLTMDWDFSVEKIIADSNLVFFEWFFLKDQSKGCIPCITGKVSSSYNCFVDFFSVIIEPEIGNITIIFLIDRKPRIEMSVDSKAMIFDCITNSVYDHATTARTYITGGMEN